MPVPFEPKPSPQTLVDPYPRKPKSLAEWAVIAEEYRREGYDAFFDLNPLTGTVALYRRDFPTGTQSEVA